MKCVKPCFEMKNIDMNGDEVKFLKGLYYLMKKYNVHRIYSASLDKKKVIVAQQLLGITIGCTAIGRKIFRFLDKYIPWLYYISYTNHIFRYTIKLNKLFKRYKIEKIGISSFKLYQGIHITSNSLCVREVDLIYKNGHICHIENLYLNMED